MAPHELSLLLFSCSGREHLLTRTYRTWKSVVAPIPEKILVLDGSYDEASIAHLDFDFVLHAKRRHGYVASISRSLPLVKSEFVFWLEDDWEPLSPIDIGHALDFLVENPRCLQLRWSKRAPLDRSGGPLREDIYRSEAGFSANPCVCRTELLREAFAALEQAEKGGRPGLDGFENFVTRWCTTHQVTCAVLDPGDEPAVLHIGYLESTPRKWHMTESLAPSAETAPGSFAKPPPLWRRFLMILKLAVIFPRLAIRQFHDNTYYDLAFRIIATFTRAKD
jgi:hypothetical protein